MEKYARQAVSEGVKSIEDLSVGGDSEIYRVLNLHYNRNNHIEVWNPQVRNYKEHAHAILLHFIWPFNSKFFIVLHVELIYRSEYKLNFNLFIL